MEGETEGVGEEEEIDYSNFSAEKGDLKLTKCHKNDQITGETFCMEEHEIIFSFYLLSSQLMIYLERANK